MPFKPKLTAEQTLKIPEMINHGKTLNDVAKELGIKKQSVAYHLNKNKPKEYGVKIMKEEEEELKLEDLIPKKKIEKEEDEYQCQECKAKISNGQKFCPGCGVELEWQ